MCPRACPYLTLSKDGGRCVACRGTGVAFDRLASLVDTLQPCFLPKKETARLATAVGLAVTPSVQMNGICHAAAADGKYRVACLVRPLVHLEPLSAILQHLRHEREPVKLGVRVKRSEDFLFASDFNPLAGA